MTQSVCIPRLTIVIACNVVPTASSLPSFVFMRGRISAKSRTAVEGRVRVSCNSQVIETFWRGSKLPVGLARGECTCVTLVIATPAIIAFAFLAYRKEKTKGREILFDLSRV